MTFFDKNALKLSHAYIKANLSPDDIVIDATAGKGRDTLLLAQTVGKGGKVYAFDIQHEAILQAKALIKENGFDNTVTFIENSHENMSSYVKKAKAVIFNLGYLPSSDHKIKTYKDSSIKAIEEALKIIDSDGFVSICIYYGGISGYDERDGVLDFLKKLSSKEFTVSVTEFLNRQNCPPIFAVIERNR